MTDKIESTVFTGPWDECLDLMRQWDPAWADRNAKMAAGPWTRGVLPRRTVELINVALNAACTNLNPEATRHHIRAALEAGATREEIMVAIQAASIPALHSCSLGAPILLEEAKAAGLQSEAVEKKAATPVSDKLKAVGQWNQAWDPILALDPEWTEDFLAMGLRLMTSGIMTAKEMELLSIALDACCTHLYAPGLRRHIKIALGLGATTEEIMEVLKLCAAQGVHACNLGVPILAEELEEYEQKTVPAIK